MFVNRIGSEHGQGDFQKGQARYRGDQANGASSLGFEGCRLRLAWKADERKPPVTQVSRLIFFICKRLSAGNEK